MQYWNIFVPCVYPKCLDFSDWELNEIRHIFLFANSWIYNWLSLQPVWKHRLSGVAWDSFVCENHLYVLSHGVTFCKQWVCHLIDHHFHLKAFVLSVSRWQPTLVKCWKMASFFFEKLILVVFICYLYDVIVCCWRCQQSHEVFFKFGLLEIGLDARKSEYDQEIPQSQAADQPMAPWGRATGHLQ